MNAKVVLPENKRRSAFLRELKGVTLAVAISFAAGVIVVLATSKTPAQALAAFFLGPFSSSLNLVTLATTMMPLVVTGLALCVSFQATVWNLAAEGQVYLGAFVGVAAGLLLSGSPAPLAVPLMLVAAGIAGGAVSLLPAALRVACEVNELITSFMTSLIVVPVVNFFLSGPMKAVGAGINATAYVNPRFLLPGLGYGGDLNVGLAIAVALVVLLQMFLYSTPLGSSLRLRGFNRNFAYYAGIEERRSVYASLLMSGGLCGPSWSADELGDISRPHDRGCYLRNGLEWHCGGARRSLPAAGRGACGVSPCIPPDRGQSFRADVRRSA